MTAMNRRVAIFLLFTVIMLIFLYDRYMYAGLRRSWYPHYPTRHPVKATRKISDDGTQPAFKKDLHQTEAEVRGSSGKPLATTNVRSMVEPTKGSLVVGDINMAITKEESVSKTDRYFQTESAANERILPIYGETTSTKPVTNLDREIILAWYEPVSLVHVKQQAELASRSMSRCAFNNCRIVFVDLTSGHVDADAVIFQGNKVPNPLPMRKSPDQPFIFFNEESPKNYHRTPLHHPVFRNFFNWTMTYRLDSDIVYPYGLIRKRGNIPTRNYTGIFLKKTDMSAWFVSHCGTNSKRQKYAEKLSNYTQVHVYGNCGTFSACPYKTNGKADCGYEIATRYKFYLAFENSLCTDYVTEKAYDWYSRDIIIVARGPGNYSRYLPPGTFIDTSQFKTVKDLAMFLNYLGNNETEYVGYLKRKDKFSVIHRDKLRHDAYCKLCEYVNDRDHYRKWYGDMNAWWMESVCRRPNDLH